ncbi:hypothetical protein E1301_Tti004729 [Triplophysa tibetana]|uniref:Uncharacterized protein n=1 Tax=Triplophysa tibetana TaxID=1572043 RepID=A0A5A9NAA0_9TELE|nr:hypothetical protein E1301_Tti004729 [Triplophysa tibetana]
MESRKATSPCRASPACPQPIDSGGVEVSVSPTLGGSRFPASPLPEHQGGGRLDLLRGSMADPVGPGGQVCPRGRLWAVERNRSVTSQKVLWRSLRLTVKPDRTDPEGLKECMAMPKVGLVPHGDKVHPLAPRLPVASTAPRSPPPAYKSQSKPPIIHHHGKGGRYCPDDTRHPPYELCLCLLSISEASIQQREWKALWDGLPVLDVNDTRT